MRLLRRKHWAFTLIELLTVVVIIIILAGLILSVAQYVQKKGATSRAQSEIAAMAAALESYKADNGVYPDDGTYSGTYSPQKAASLSPISMVDPTKPEYKSACLVLYKALSGDTTCDSVVTVADAVNGATTAPTIYFAFKPGQLLMSGSTVNAIADPFGYSYGYSTAYALTGSNGYNPTYDLWSTSGNTTTSGTAQWITNW